MSYTILYNAMFVKLSDGRYIPMVEMGDSNVYETDRRGRSTLRVREWRNIKINAIDNIIYTKEDIINSLNERYTTIAKKCAQGDMPNWENLNNNFGYFDSLAIKSKMPFNTTFNDIKNFLLSGIKNCITFDDAVIKCGLKVIRYDDGKVLEPFETEEEMFSKIKNDFGNVKYFFTFQKSANNFFTAKKAIKNLCDGRGKIVRPCIVICRIKDFDDTFYLKIDKTTGSISLTEDINKATAIAKTKACGMDVFTIIRNELGYSYGHIYGIEYRYIR